jgi:RNA recognition motif-containing protein
MRDDRSRGFGYVSFKTIDAAKTALLKDGSELEGR